VDVEDPSRDIVGLVADKLNDAGIRAFVYLFDNKTNAVADDAGGDNADDADEVCPDLKED
jgi:hypothetical protein